MLIIILLLAPFRMSHAINCLPSHPIIKPSYDITAKMLHKVAEFDESDREDAAAFGTHETISEAAVKSRYAATGDIVCNGRRGGQANVTIVGDVITTSAHSIFGKNGCGKAKQAVPKCKLIAEVEGKKEEYELSHVVNTGWICGTGDVKQGSTDWAVCRLKRKVDSRIKPYKVGPDLARKQFVGMDLTFVSKSDDWPKKSKLDYPDKPKHYGNCKAIGSSNFDFAESMTTNCDADTGSSGGSVVTRGPDPELLAVMAGMSTKDKYKCPDLSASKKSGPSGECWHSSAAMITGDFRATLEEIQNEQPSEDSKKGTPL